MFDKDRYVTKGINEKMPSDAQKVHKHKSEYEFFSVDGNYVEGKVYVIYEGVYATKPWAEEY